MCIQISQRRGRPTHSVWKSLKKSLISQHWVNVVRYRVSKLNIEFLARKLIHVLVGFKHCGFSSAFQHIHFSRKRNGKKRSIINKPSFIQHTMVENMVCIFWFNASLRSIKPPFCLTKSNLDIIVSSVLQKAIQQQNKMGVMLLPNID